MRKTTSVYLDLARLLAALLVFFGHAYNFTDGKVVVLPGHASEAVAIFFVLSGFVIAYVVRKGEANASEYAAARFARIYSVAIPTIVATFLFDRIGMHFSHALYDGATYFSPGFDPLNVARYLSFTNEIWNTHAIVGTDEPYWSLGFEVCYYFLFGVIMFVAVPRGARVMLVALLLLVIGPKVAVYFGLWLLGVATFKLLDFCERRKFFDSVRVWWFLYFATPLLYVAMRLVYRRLGILPTPMYYAFTLTRQMFWSVTYFYLLGFIFSLNVIAFAACSRAQSVVKLMNRVAGSVRWLAGATFTLYLAHQPILIALVSMAGVIESKATAWAVVGGTLAVVLLLAEVSERRKWFWRAIFNRAFGLHHGSEASRTA